MRMIMTDDNDEDSDNDNDNDDDNNNDDNNNDSKTLPKMVISYCWPVPVSC